MRWTTLLDPTQHSIVCFYEKEGPKSRKPNWESVEHNCKTHTDWHEWQKTNKGWEIYVRIDNITRTFSRARNIPYRAGLNTVRGIAYPSTRLEQEVRRALQQAHHFTFYQILGWEIPRELSPCIYIVSEQNSVSMPKSPIYVGLTKRSMHERLKGHRRSEKAGFMDYMGDRHEVSADWSVHILPYEACQSFAVQGQVTPDLIGDQEAQHSFNEKYLHDPQWGLEQGETALITYFHPHFNKAKNTNPNALQYTNYCEQGKCWICSTHKK